MKLLQTRFQIILTKRDRNRGGYYSELIRKFLCPARDFGERFDEVFLSEYL